MIYHITSRAEWETAREGQTYAAPSLTTEGFIHCSTAAQILRVANAFYRGQRDLVLLCVEASRLSSKLKWESPAHGEHENPIHIGKEEVFPHIYGHINLEAVLRVIDFSPDQNGVFSLPNDIELE